MGFRARFLPGVVREFLLRSTYVGTAWINTESSGRFRSGASGCSSILFGATNPYLRVEIVCMTAYPAAKRSLAFRVLSPFEERLGSDEAALRCSRRCADAFDSEIRIRRNSPNEEQPEAPNRKRPDDSVLIEDPQPGSTCEGVPARRPAGTVLETSRQRPSEPLGADRPITSRRRRRPIP